MTVRRLSHSQHSIKFGMMAPHEKREYIKKIDAGEIEIVPDEERFPQGEPKTIEEFREQNQALGFDEFYEKLQGWHRRRAIAEARGLDSE